MLSSLFFSKKWLAGEQKMLKPKVICLNNVSSTWNTSNAIRAICLRTVFSHMLSVTISVIVINSRKARRRRSRAVQKWCEMWQFVEEMREANEDTCREVQSAMRRKQMFNFHLLENCSNRCWWEPVRWPLDSSANCVCCFADYPRLYERLVWTFHIGSFAKAYQIWSTVADYQPNGSK